MYLKVSLFQDADVSFIKLISHYCKPVFIPKDEFIIKKGDNSPSVSLIIRYEHYIHKSYHIHRRILSPWEQLMLCQKMVKLCMTH